MNDTPDKKSTHKDIDKITGIETTGHEWDGIKELNNPMPRWWLWVFFVTILWSIGYWVVYPSWPIPGGATKGTMGYTQNEALKESQDEIKARQQVYLDKFEEASLQDILKDPQLYAFAVAGGASVFKDNCATCHGAGASGRKGYPNLNDDDWLWGGRLSDIHQTIQYGVRAGNMETRLSQMPAFGKEKLLTRAEIDAVVDYVLTLSGDSKTSTYEQGKTVFKAQCASCHGEDGKGFHDVGSANLTDKIWLYGGDRKTVYETVYNARAGVMPAWGTRLSENTLKQLTIYLHQLGGGEEEPENVPADSKRAP